jgi:hypothetical protein
MEEENPITPAERVIPRYIKANATGEKRTLSPQQKAAMARGMALRNKLNRTSPAEWMKRYKYISDQLAKWPVPQVIQLVMDNYDCSENTARAWVNKWMQQEGVEIQRRITTGSAYARLVRVLESRLDNAIANGDDDNIVKYTQTLLKTYGYAPGEKAYTKSRPRPKQDQDDGRKNIQNLVNAKMTAPATPPALPPPPRPEGLQILNMMDPMQAQKIMEESSDAAIDG